MDDPLATLQEALIRRGWQRQGRALTAPHGSMWLDLDGPWWSDLGELSERMQGRMQRIQRTLDELPEYREESAEALADVTSLVEALRELQSHR